jgi:hypothetical protein
MFLILENDCYCETGLTLMSRLDLDVMMFRIYLSSSKSENAKIERSGDEGLDDVNLTVFLFVESAPSVD